MSPVKPPRQPARRAATPAAKTSTRAVQQSALRAPFTPDPGNRSLHQRKDILRNLLTQQRRSIPADLRDTTRWKVINHLRTLIGQVSPAAIGLYYPVGTEIDLRPLAEELWRSGQTVCLPRRVYPGHPMVFNVWSPEDPLHPDALDHPAADGPAITPSIIIMPALGYNRRGYRLATAAARNAPSGNDYDITIKALRWPVTSVGVCYTELEIPDFPVEYADIRLDAIVTGREVIFC